jgi:hypothetical protein
MTKLIDIDSLESDLRAEVEGEEIEVKDWPTVGPVPGLAFTVRSTQYPPYIAARTAEQQRLSKKFDGGVIPPDELARVDGNLAVEHLLLGWKGLSVKYSREVAEDYLLRPAQRKLRDMVFWCATRVGVRDVQFIEVEAKN